MRHCIQTAYYKKCEKLYLTFIEANKEEKDTVIVNLRFGAISIIKALTHPLQKLGSTVEAPVMAIINVAGVIFGIDNCSMKDAALSLCVDLPFHAVELLVSPVTAVAKCVFDLKRFDQKELESSSESFGSNFKNLIKGDFISTRVSGFRFAQKDKEEQIKDIMGF